MDKAPRRLRDYGLMLFFVSACVGLGLLAGRQFALRSAPQAPAPARMTVQAVDNRSLLEGADRRVVLYSQATCGASDAVRAWLQEEGIAFEERVVEKPNAYWQEVVAMDARTTPLILTATHRIEGFDPPRLRALLDDLPAAR